MDYYLSIPSTELWNLNVLDNTLNQIAYYAVSDNIATPSDALLLCERMEALVQHIKAMTEKGKKFLPNKKTANLRNDFSLFHNEIIYTNNTIIVVTDVQKVVYSTLGNPNYLKTADLKVVDLIENWFKKIMAKSQPISLHAEKSRNLYFNELLKKVHLVLKRIKNGY